MTNLGNSLKLFFALILLVEGLFSCAKEEVSPVANTQPTTVTSSFITNDSLLKYDAYLFDLTNKYPQMPDVQFNGAWVQVGSLSGGLDHCHFKYYSLKGVDHIILNPTSVSKVPLIHLINKGSKWELEKIYDGLNSNFGSPNSSEVGTDGSYFISEYGSEAFGTDNMPGGPVVRIQTNDDLTLTITRVSGPTNQTFMSNASGDFNGDNLVDNVSSLFGPQSGKFSGIADFMIFLQNSDGSFREDRNIILDPKFTEDQGGTSVTTSDLLGDSHPEIIKSGAFLGIAIFAWNSQIQKYQYLKTNTDPGFFKLDKSMNRSPIMSRSADLNNDGFNDVVIQFEGPPGGGLQIWWNDGKGNLSAGPQYINSNANMFAERGFDIVDINGDGWLDIFLGGWIGPNTAVNLKNNFWLNSKDKNFKFYDKDIIINPTNKSNAPHQIRAYRSNGKFKIIGLTGMYDFLEGPGRYQFKIIEMGNFKL